MTYKEIFTLAVPKEKRDEDKFAFVSTYLSRPISIFITKPLLKTDIRATSVTKLSVFFLLVAFFLLVLGDSITIHLAGWIFLFLWAILDHVDGNIARIKNDCSLLGDLWDTMGGYLAMIVMYFAAGILAFRGHITTNFFDLPIYLILGGATSLFSIFPRLMMHKKKSSVKEAKIVNELTDKKNFNLPKIFVLNLLAPTDGLLFIFLISLLLNLFDYFFGLYFILNLLVMIIALRGILREE